MISSKVQKALQEQSNKSVTALNEHKRDIEKAVKDFLSSSNDKKCLLFTTQDSTVGASRILQILQDLEEDQKNEKILDRYLGKDNQTILSWKQLLTVVGKIEKLHIFKNLLVCFFPNDEPIKIKENSVRKIIGVPEKSPVESPEESPEISVLKKVIFITSRKNLLDQYLQKIDSKAFHKIDECEDNVSLMSLVIHDKETNLLVTASQGDVNGVKELLKKGDNINASSGVEDSTPLHGAAAKGHNEVISTLLEYGADIFLPNKYGDLPLHTAARNGHSGVVSLLLENGVNVNIRGGWGQTALFEAVLEGHKNLVETLLKYNVNVNALNRGTRQVATHGDSPLHAAATLGYTDIVQLLLENYAKVNNEYGQTPLHCASENNHSEVVLMLLNYDATVNAIDESGNTPLHVAALNDSRDVINTLVNNGADINAENNNKNTPLQCAVKNGHLEIVKALIEISKKEELQFNKVNFNAKDREGKTAYMLSIDWGYKEIATVLQPFTTR